MTDVIDLDTWNQQLLGGTPYEKVVAANNIGNFKSSVDKEFIVTVCDRLWVPIREVGIDMISLEGDDPRNDLPTAKLVLKGTSDLTDVFRGCRETLVGVIIETQGIRLAYYVDTFDEDFTNGAWTGTANLHGIWDILNYMVIWPNFLFPIQVQIPSHAVFAWGLCTVIESMVGECALRLQSGLWELINNVIAFPPSLDVRAWFGTLLQSNGNIFDILKCPVYVVHTNPFFDTSPLCVKTVRMETCGAMIREITKAYGVDVRVDLWLPGDEQPDYWTQHIGFMRLTQPTYVVSATDRSQIKGPTGTIIDSAIRTLTDIGGSFFGEAGQIIKQVPGMDGVYYSPLLGQNYVPPWAMLVAPYPDKGEKGNIVSCKISHHTPKGWQHIIGGRSPKWVVALSGNRGGNHPGHPLTQRPDERHVRVDHRQHLDSDRLHRHPLQPAGGLHEQRAARVRVAPDLLPAQRGRPVPPGRRGVPRDQLGALQRGDDVRVHQRGVGFARLRVSSGADAQRRRLQLRQGHFPRRPGQPRLPEPHPTVHRLRRERLLQGRRQHSRYVHSDR